MSGLLEKDLCILRETEGMPELVPLTEDIMLRVASELHDPVTTIEELLPFGEAADPQSLAARVLSERDPGYVARTKEVWAAEVIRRTDTCPLRKNQEIGDAFRKVKEYYSELRARSVEISTVVFALKPGEGANSEPAVFGQRVLGGLANIAREYAAGSYRSNLIKWGMLPFVYEGEHETLPFGLNDFIFVPGIREAVESGQSTVKAYVVKETLEAITLKLGVLSEEERTIILAGGRINIF